MKYTDIPILMYHDIGDSTSLWSVSPASFVAQMSYLQEAGYRTISLDELYQGVGERRSTSEKLVVLTFDDARQGVYTAAFPLLKKLGFTGTIFVVPQWIEGKEVPPEEQFSAFLSWEQLKELSAQMFVIGSHSFSHKNLTALSPEVLRQELQQAEEMIIQKVGIQKISVQNGGVKPSHFAYPLAHPFAYPFGLHNPTVLQEVRQRYTVAVSTQRGFAKEPGKYARQWILRDTSLEMFQKLLHRPTISLCMIVKDEEQHLASCLESVQGLIDEIVMMDTGSTDRTLEIARQFHSRIFEVPWQDDFALARNESLKQATGDWILILDADEVLSVEEQGQILEAVNDWETGGFRIMTRNYSNDSTITGWQPAVQDTVAKSFARSFAGWYPSLKVRLFQRRSSVVFRGKVHEQIPAEVLGNVRSLPIAVHHYGIQAGKIQRNVFLTEKKVAEEPTAQACYELGVQYKELGKYADAEEMFLQALALHPGAIQVGILLNLAVVEQKQGKIEEALIRYEEMLRQENHPEAHFGAGYCYFRKNDLLKSQEHFQQCLRRNPRHVEAWVNLAAVNEQLGKYPEAFLALDRALYLHPQHARAYYNKGVVWEKAGRPEKAIACYRQAAELGYVRKEEALERARKLEELMGDG